MFETRTSAKLKKIYIVWEMRTALHYILQTQNARINEYLSFFINFRYVTFLESFLSMVKFFYDTTTQP